MAGLAPILNRFRELYPGAAPPKVWRAPGRVNLIGEHTDYNLGLVLPMAIGLECMVAAAPSAAGVLCVYSDQFNEFARWGIEEIPGAKPRGDWTDRVAGIARELASRGGSVRSQNVLISSTIPIGGGLSSSAALSVAMGMALGAPADPLELARIARAAEVNFAGVPCGIMDPFIATHGQAGAAILLDCRSLEFCLVMLPEPVAVVAVNSMVKHELGDSAYRRRVEECAEAARRLGLASLREATQNRLGELSGVPLRRARHVLTENARVVAFAAAAGRADLATMGQALIESHRSLRDDYEVSGAELDFLVETAMAVPGVIGARMTGGGFGGSIVALVHRKSLEKLESALMEKYTARFGRTPEIHYCDASRGASQLI